MRRTTFLWKTEPSQPRGVHLSILSLLPSTPYVVFILKCLEFYGVGSWLIVMTLVKQTQNPNDLIVNRPQKFWPPLIDHCPYYMHTLLSMSCKSTSPVLSCLSCNRWSSCVLECALF